MDLAFRPSDLSQVLRSRLAMLVEGDQCARFKIRQGDAHPTSPQIESEVELGADFCLLCIACVRDAVPLEMTLGAERLHLR